MDITLPISPETDRKDLQAIIDRANPQKVVRILAVAREIDNHDNDDLYLASDFSKSACSSDSAEISTPLAFVRKRGFETIREACLANWVANGMTDTEASELYDKLFVGKGKTPLEESIRINKEISESTKKHVERGLDTLRRFK